MSSSLFLENELSVLTKIFIRSFLSSDEKKLLIEKYNLGLLITDSMFFEYATLEEAYP